MWEQKDFFELVALLFSLLPYVISATPEGLNVSGTMLMREENEKEHLS